MQNQKLPTENFSIKNLIFTICVSVLFVLLQNYHFRLIRVLQFMVTSKIRGTSSLW